MPGPRSAFILLDAPTELVSSRISDTLTARHPGLPIAMPPPEGQSEKATVLSYSGSVVAIMEFDAPLPDGWQSAASRAGMHWPEAEAVFRRHRGHLSSCP